MRELKVLIVGAGIGGLQTALALAADGHKVTVLESVKEFLEVHRPTLPKPPLTYLTFLGRCWYSRTAKFLPTEP